MGDRRAARGIVPNANLGGLDVSPRAKKIAFGLALACLPVVTLALVEGMASLALLGHRLLVQPRTMEEVHTEPDTLLGWVNQRNVNRPDLYGPGIGLRTNGQRFRHVGEVAPRPPAGTRRLICSGDSFTLGYDVGDGQAWCDRLGQTVPGLETVNMGQGGYGVDQAYLWYLRDGIGLHPDIHIFAFIQTDFGRMMDDRFIGFPKPRLVVDGDSVRAEGIPVPRPDLGRTLIRWNAALRDLRSSQLIGHVVGGRPKATTPDPQVRATWEVARAAFHDLVRRDSASGATLVFVLLPTIGDYRSEYRDPWRRWLGEAAARHEFTYVDLIDPLRKVPPDSVEALFVPREGRHLSVAGNIWVAEQLRRRIEPLSGSVAH